MKTFKPLFVIKEPLLLVSSFLKICFKPLFLTVLWISIEFSSCHVILIPVKWLHHFVLKHSLNRLDLWKSLQIQWHLLAPWIWCFTLALVKFNANLHKSHAITPLSLLLLISSSKEQPLMLVSVLIMGLTARIYTLWFLLQWQLSFWL